MGSGTGGISIGHATSPDGLTWTKDPSNPVLTAGSAGNWDNPRVDCPTVIFDGDTFHMWYAGGDLFQWKIGYALVLFIKHSGSNEKIIFSDFNIFLLLFLYELT